jgi:hypothetical protein
MRDPQRPQAPALSVLPVDMDGLSAAATVFSLLAVASTLVKSCYAAASSALRYRKEISELADDVALLVGFLHAQVAPVDEYGGSKPSVYVVTAPAPQGHVPTSPTNSASSSSPQSDSESVVIVDGQVQLTWQLRSEVEACRKTLDEIGNFLAHFGHGTTSSSVGKFTKIAHWLLRAPDFKRFHLALERHKNNFTLLLSAKGTYLISFAKATG